jgi:hypothetical protein
MMGAPAEAAAKEREGRETPKRDGEQKVHEELEDFGKEPTGGEGKFCLVKRREDKVGGPMVVANLMSEIESRESCG